MIYKLSTAIVLYVCTSLFSLTYAHGLVDAHIVEVRVDNNGKTIVTFDSDINHQPPACSGNNHRVMAFDATTEGGKAMLSLALTAHSTQKLVRGRGTGVCTVWNSIETVGYLVIKKV